eukprot:TRINITY_DN815_c0_g1_i2.p1 TRINITY_DN815_c0_g1~~TRINITY_DN815_c0_g1_i2.p1  ORF type:complete len:688 (-),score=125.24 TRINITY_DN815_c0_g1_i2:273-2336(-)
MSAASRHRKGSGGGDGGAGDPMIAAPPSSVSLLHGGRPSGAAPKVYDSMGSTVNTVHSKSSTVTSIRNRPVAAAAPAFAADDKVLLKNLVDLRNLGEISEEEFHARRIQIINRVTGTLYDGPGKPGAAAGRVGGSGSVTKSRKNAKLSKTVTLRPHLPPKNVMYGGPSDEERKSVESKHKRASPTNPLPELILKPASAHNSNKSIGSSGDMLNRSGPLLKSLVVPSAAGSGVPATDSSCVEAKSDLSSKERGDPNAVNVDSHSQAANSANSRNAGADVVNAETKSNSSKDRVDSSDLENVDPQKSLPVESVAVHDECNPPRKSSGAAPSKSFDLGPVEFGDKLSDPRECAKSVDYSDLKQLAKKVELPDPWLNSRPPPNFSGMSCERAIKYTFDASTGEWNQKEIVVKIDPVSFAKGSLRVAYHCLEVCDFKPSMDLDSMLSVNTGMNCVAKIAYFLDEDVNSCETYFLDVWMQSYLARKFSEAYNFYDPPKKIQFINAWVMKLVDRDCLCGVEPYIGRDYMKFNNNNGYVSEIDRNTPQAFSHFSYFVSDSKLLICDIQGVGDQYTDPQVHSQNGGLYGAGDMGREGINKFFATHRCNPLCKFFKLPPLNSNTIVVGGTVPADKEVSQVSSIWQDIHDGPEMPTASILSETGVGKTETDVIGLPPKQTPASRTPSSYFRCCVCTIL